MAGCTTRWWITRNRIVAGGGAGVRLLICNGSDRTVQALSDPKGIEALRSPGTVVQWLLSEPPHRSQIGMSGPTGRMPAPEDEAPERTFNPQRGWPVIPHSRLPTNLPSYPAAASGHDQHRLWRETVIVQTEPRPAARHSIAANARFPR